MGRTNLYFTSQNGYVGASRSERSQAAIENYEMPISMMSKSIIDTFLSLTRDDFDPIHYDLLKSTPVSKWRFVAKTKMQRSSWHHTSSRFNKTDHFSLHAIAEKILEVSDTLEDEYRAHLNHAKTSAPAVKYGVICVQVWGGSKAHPKVIGHEQAAGIIQGEWLYYKTNHLANGATQKYKTTANKVDWITVYPTYRELTQNHPEYKKTKAVFNALIKEREPRVGQEERK